MGLFDSVVVRPLPEHLMICPECGARIYKDSEGSWHKSGTSARFWRRHEDDGLDYDHGDWCIGVTQEYRVTLMPI